MSLDLNDVVDNNFLPPFSKKEFEQRFQKVRAAMKENGLDCLIIYGAHAYMGTDLGQTTAVYLANYAAFGHEYVIVPLEAEPTLILPIITHIPNAQALSPIKDIRCTGIDIEKCAGDRLKELGLEKGNIGIVGPWGTWWSSFSIPAEHRDYFTQTFPKATFRVVTEMYERARLIKSEEEITHLERAAAINDVCQEEIILTTRPGVRHSELYETSLITSTRLGGNVPFIHISSTPMANPNMFYPDPYPTFETVKHGDALLTEHAVGYGGYYAKIMSTWFVGEPAKEYRKMFDLVVSVYERTLQDLKPGMTGHDAAKLVEPIAKAGYIHFPLISGWSTYNHMPMAGVPQGLEFPGVQKEKEDFVFKPGMTSSVWVVAVAPDLKSGVWISTLCLFTKNGLRSFHKYDVTKLRIV